MTYAPFSRYLLMLNLMMRTAFLCLLLGVGLPWPGLALPPHQVAPLYEHLLEVNARWAWQPYAESRYCQEITFKDDTERIRYHLLMAGQELAQSPSPDPERQDQRRHLLAQLAAYREARRFPVNDQFAWRQPLFFDAAGQACAVGHLMLQSGASPLAHRISREMNAAYLLDMLPNPALQAWAEAQGFRAEELALIQPTYSPTVGWTTLGEGADGTVTALHPGPDGLIVAGNFSTLDGVPCAQVGVYAQGTFSPLGTGVSGDIQAIAVYQNQLYLGGSFEGGANIAWWDSEQWTLEQIAPGAVHALEVYEGTLYAGGTFKDSTRSVHFIARQVSAGDWQGVGYFSAPVYTLAVHLDRLYAGGALTQQMDQPYRVAVLSTDARRWSPVTNYLEDWLYTARSLASDGTYLYAVGDRLEDSVKHLGIARLGNSGWQRLLETEASYSPTGSYLQHFSQVYVHQGRILVGADFRSRPFVGTHGGGLAELTVFGPYVGFEPLATVDSTVQAITALGGVVYIGGAFKYARYGQDSVAHLLRSTAITPQDAMPVPAAVSLYPLPVGQQAHGHSPGVVLTRVEAYDLAGRVHSLRLETQGAYFSLWRDPLPAGIYVLRYWAEDRLVGQAKVMFR